MLGKYFCKMHRTIVSVAVVLTKFTVRWKFVLPRLSKLVIL